MNSLSHSPPAISRDAPGHHSFNPVSAISLFVVLALPCWLMLQTGLSLVSAWSSYALISYLITFNFLYRKHDFLYASFLVFFYVFLILAPILQVSNGYFPWYGFYSDYDTSASWWVTFCALLSFELGYILNRSSTPSRLSHSSYELSESGKMLLFWVAIACALFGLSFLGISYLFLPRIETSLEHIGLSASFSSIIRSIMRVPPVLIFLILLMDLMKKIRTGRSRKDRWSTIKFLLPIGLLVVIINNPISTPRFWVGTIFLSTLLLYLTVFTKKKAFFWFASNLLILVAVFPVMDLFRASLDTNIVQAIQEIDPGRELKESPDFDAFQQQMNATLTTEIRGHSYGVQTLSSLLFFVPRSIWPGKYQPSGATIGETMGYDFLNLSAPISAELYLDGWFFGVIVGLFMMGFFYRKLYVHYRFGNSDLISLFYIFFCTYQAYFLRGSLMAVIGFLFIAGLSVLITSRFKHVFFKPIRTQAATNHKERRYS